MKKLYQLVRPYCTPGTVFCFAKTKQEAIKKTHSAYGFCGETTVIKTVTTGEDMETFMVGTDSIINRRYALPQKVKRKIVKRKRKDNMKLSCFKCDYLFPNEGFGRFKCYCGDCPAKIRDEKQK